MPENERYVIEILDVALNALEAMAFNEEEFHSPASLARKLNINRSRLFRILKTLERRGYAKCDPKTGYYRLGLNFVSLGQKIQEHLSLRREAEDLLDKLANDTGDCVHFLVLSEESAIVIDRYVGENTLQVAQPIGKPLPLHTGAGPKLLLAYLPEAEREKILASISYDRYTPNTIPDSQVLRNMLLQIRKDGYAFDDQEYEIGVYAIGAPVFDHTGTVVASVSIAVPAIRYVRERHTSLVEMTVAASKEISSRLGYQPNLSGSGYRSQNFDNQPGAASTLPSGK
jgi:DNA-binding IclR family transcriptional regulator